MQTAWDTAADPAPLLALARRRPAPAPAYLRFTAGCCRLVEHLAPDPAWRAALPQAEAFADGELTDLRWDSFPEWHRHRAYPARDVALALAALFPYSRGAPPNLAGAADHAAGAVGHVASALASAAAGPAPADAAPDHPWHAAWAAGYAAALGDMADLARCVFGPPDPPAFDARWRSADAAGLAAAVAARRAFTDLLILADALEDAGCDLAGLLAHCRCGRPHAHGCWALDAVLRGG